ncbi:MAG: hypothetical protein IV100_01160 [Myxococcales bacterium]|nr:hypothetical protein [Myxococcales bacterium]
MGNNIHVKTLSCIVGAALLLHWSGCAGDDGGGIVAPNSSDPGPPSAPDETGSPVKDTSTAPGKAFPGQGIVAPMPKVAAVSKPPIAQDEGDWQPDPNSEGARTFEDELKIADIIVSGTVGQVLSVTEYASQPFDQGVGTWEVVALVEQAFQADGEVLFTFNEFATPGSMLDTKIVGPLTNSTVALIDRVASAWGPTQIIDGNGSSLPGYDQVVSGAVGDDVMNTGLAPGQRFLFLIQVTTLPAWSVAEPAVTVYRRFGQYKFDGKELIGHNGVVYAWEDVKGMVPAALASRRVWFESFFNELMTPTEESVTTGVDEIDGSAQ